MKKLILTVLASTLFAGCASVPLEKTEVAAKAKQFSTPSEGKAGLYIYRDGSFGGALKKDIWVNGECVGQSAPNVFFFEEVAGGAEHTISTESEFSPNDLIVSTESGKNYFVEQYIKMGVFVGGAGLKQVDELEGKSIVSGLDMASKGACSK